MGACKPVPSSPSIRHAPKGAVFQPSTVRALGDGPTHAPLKPYNLCSVAFNSYSHPQQAHFTDLNLVFDNATTFSLLHFPGRAFLFSTVKCVIIDEKKRTLCL